MGNKINSSNRSNKSQNNFNMKSDVSETKSWIQKIVSTNPTNYPKFLLKTYGTEDLDKLSKKFLSDKSMSINQQILEMEKNFDKFLLAKNCPICNGKFLENIFDFPCKECNNRHCVIALFTSNSDPEEENKKYEQVTCLHCNNSDFFLERNFLKEIKAVFKKLNVSIPDNKILYTKYSEFNRKFRSLSSARKFYGEEKFSYWLKEFYGSDVNIEIFVRTLDIDDIRVNFIEKFSEVLIKENFKVENCPSCKENKKDYFSGTCYNCFSTHYKIDDITENGGPCFKMSDHSVCRHCGYGWSSCY